MHPRRLIALALPLLLLCSCPSSRFYAPSTEEERDALASSRRDVFPDDVRHDLDGHRSTRVAWAGIIESARWDDDDESTAEFLIEHHYWDWIEDHSVQPEVAFLSPRGEGLFFFRKQAEEANVNAALPPTGTMAIVYGHPEAVRPDGVIVLQEVSVSFAPREWYGTDIWDYGREYLLHGNEADLKVLRVPLW